MSVSICLTPDLDGYRLFLQAKKLPVRRFVGSTVEIPDEYAHLLGVAEPARPPAVPYVPLPGLFDYQSDVSALSIRKRKYCVFAVPGIGKTLILLEFARHVASLMSPGRGFLLVSPLRVIRQTLEETRKFYGDSLPIRQLAAKDVRAWISAPDGIAITNYESIKEPFDTSKLDGMGLDESQTLKSHYGAWGQRLIEMGRGLPWKLACTGTPAPNDPIEYANHAVFMDHFPNVNAFLAKYFVNRGQTGERWELKDHARTAFYRELSHWSIFLTDPADYGWKDNPQSSRPAIHIHIHNVDLTPEQHEQVRIATGKMFVNDLGGIVTRGKLAKIAKSETGLKPAYIRSLVESWPDESTLIWCWHNDEHDLFQRMFPQAASIRGGTKLEVADRLIEDFQAGRRKILISKPKVLGLGLNLQVATRHVFSGLRDSYEEFVQAIMRSNRINSTKDLNVHVPVTDLELPMVHNVLRKAARVEADARLQQELFRCNRI